MLLSVSAWVHSGIILARRQAAIGWLFFLYCADSCCCPVPPCPCSVLEARPPQDYEPWAVALPYLYKLERLLPCRQGVLVFCGNLSSDAALHLG